MANPTSDPSTPTFYDASTTALLLLDFHQFFVEMAGGPKAPNALNVAVKMRTWAKSQGITVIHALVDMDDTPFPSCKGVDKLMEFKVNMKKAGDGEAPQLQESLSDDEVTFTRKPGYVSALKSPGLREFLQGKGIKSLILTGLSTSGCVLRTAIPATDDEFVVSVISDGCADRDDDVHNLVLEKVLPSRGYVTSAAEFQQEYEKARQLD